LFEMLFHSRNTSKQISKQAQFLVCNILFNTSLPLVIVVARLRRGATEESCSHRSQVQRFFFSKSWVSPNLLVIWFVQLFPRG